MTFFSALLLGLLASAHCAGMCGGLQSSLQQSAVIRSTQQAIIHLCALNLGRLSTYCLLGFIFGSLGTKLLGIIDIPKLTASARIIAALFLVALGVQLIFSNAKPFRSIEKFGASLWKLISLYKPANNINSTSRSYRLGLIWGFLPCGLVYGVLLTTLFANDGLQGVSTLLGFGLGTMPALVLTGSVYQKLRSVVRAPYLKLFGGAIFIQGGLLMILAPTFISLDFTHGYPEVMATMFCVS